MNNTEYYERLGVSKDASQDDIKKAYRKLSKKYHPDLNQEAGADQKYKEVQEAYETLSDPQKRAQYDQFGPAGANGGYGGQGYGGQGFGGYDDINDLFSQMFGGGFGGFDPNRPRKGQDLQYRMHLTFEEAVFGTEKTITYTRSENGMQQKHEVKVTIPAGVDTGQQMRLQNQGEEGANGGPYGDLFVVFNVAPSQEGFERDGADVYLETEISFVSAALGDEIEVPTVHGKAKLKIPAGTQTGTNFRLRGQGAPRLRQNGNGDQFVRVQVSVPTKLNKDQKKALEAFQEASTGHKKHGFFG